MTKETSDSDGCGEVVVEVFEIMLSNLTKQMSIFVKRKQ